TAHVSENRDPTASLDAAIRVQLGAEHGSDGPGTTLFIPHENLAERQARWEAPLVDKAQHHCRPQPLATKNVDVSVSVELLPDRLLGANLHHGMGEVHRDAVGENRRRLEIDVIGITENRGVQLKPKLKGE